MIVGLLLWIRGLAETEIVEKPTTNDHIDISVWPPGLHPPYSENFTDEYGDEVIRSEFIIAYAPENNKTKELVEQRMLDRLKVDVMRYSNEEAIIKMLVESMWTKIQEMDDAKNVSSCNDLIDLLNESFPVPILEKDVDWCQEFNNNTDKVDNFDGDGNKNVWNDDNKRLVNDNIILPEINGILWDPCKRQTIFTALYEMKNNVLCDVPEERLVENDDSSFFGMLFDGLTASPDDYEYNNTDYNEDTYDDTETFDDTTQEPRVTEISDKQYHLNYLDSRKQEHIRIVNQSMHDVLGSIWSERKSVGEVFSASKKERKASRMDGFGELDNLSNLINTIHENMIKLKYDTLNTFILNVGNLAWNRICGEITAQEPKFSIKIKGFPSWEKFEEWSDNKLNEDNLRNTLAGIQFHYNEFHENMGLNYSLRMRPTRHNYQGGFQARMRSSMENDHEIGRNWVTNQVLMPMQMSMPRSSFRPSSWCTGGRPYYYNEGFLSIQRALDKSYIDFVTDQEEEESSGSSSAEYEHSFLKILPYGPYNNDVYPTILQSFIVFMIMTSYIRLAFNIAKNVVTEKETKIKEYMKTMGTGTYIQWFAWFVHYFIITSIMNGLFVGLTTSKTTSEFSRYLCNLVRDNPINADAEPIIQFSNPFCLWVVIQVYLVETIWQIFFLTTFFDQASTAAGISGFVHFISYTPWNNIMRAYKTSFPLLAKHLLCFIPLLGNAQSWWIIGLLEGKTEGLQWSNFNAYMVSKNDMTILNCLLTQLFFTLVYAIMTFYVELIRPGLWGVSKPWYFPAIYFFDLFKISDKTKTKLFSSLEIMQKSDEEQCLNSHKYYESLSKQDSQNIAIQIHNIRKIYSNGKLAVDGLELEMVKGQITALLGHNGAGKTTTMNMLIGMLAPSSGYAKINGHDIRHDLDVIRKNLGICPQFDILFTLLTVEEHLRFFSEMKSGKVDELDVEDIIRRMGLGRYRKNYPSELSGGWKRRVSVAIALVGGSDVIVLDEPTGVF